MRIAGVLLAASVLTVGPAIAAPIAVDYDLLRGVVEDFEGDAPGPGGGSVAYDGFTVTTDSAHWTRVSDEPPCGPANRCLEATVSPLYSPIFGTPVPPVTATFTDFVPGTRSFGLRLPGTFPDLSGEVVGVSGSTSILIFTPPGATVGPLKLAWHDPAGLLSVTVTHPRHFDDVLTSALAPIPLPPAGAFMLVALGGLALFRRRRGARPAPVRAA